MHLNASGWCGILASTSCSSCFNGRGHGHEVAFAFCGVACELHACKSSGDEMQREGLPAHLLQPDATWPVGYRFRGYPDFPSIWTICDLGLWMAIATIFRVRNNQGSATRDALKCSFQNRVSYNSTIIVREIIPYPPHIFITHQYKGR